MKFEQGDLAKVVDNKYPPYHFFDEGTVVRIGEHRGTRPGRFTLYYCTDLNTGLVQLIPSHQLEKIEN